MKSLDDRDMKKKIIIIQIKKNATQNLTQCLTARVIRVKHLTEPNCIFLLVPFFKAKCPHNVKWQRVLEIYFLSGLFSKNALR